MSFSERNLEHSARGVHPDFKITQDNVWYSNRDLSLLQQEKPSVKCRFIFADRRLLDQSPFLTKISVNTDRDVHLPYMGFAYASADQAQALEAWGNRFPHADLVMLDPEDTPTEDIEHVILTRQ